MPDYSSARLLKDEVKLTEGSWYPIEWGTDDGPFVKGDPGIRLSGKKYSLSLQVTVSNRGGATIRTSTVERADNETEETNAQVTHDKDYAQDSRNGLVQKDRVLRCRVMCDGPGAVLKNATVQVLYW